MVGDVCFSASEDLADVVKEGGAIICEPHPSQSTFAGLSDLVHDLFGGSQYGNPR